MTGALAQVREVLGPDALILETRRLPATARRPAEVVVLAACDTGPDLPPAPQRARGTVSPAPARIAPVPPSWQAELEAAQEKIRYLSRLVSSDHFSRLTPWARELYLDLVESEVDASLALGILENLCAGANATRSPRERLRRQLASLVRVGGGLAGGHHRRRILVLAGGPGVGKTTTCAKLAARLRDSGLGVGLLSLDTQRVAGALHLGSYAEILGLPAVVAYTADELREALGGPLAPLPTILVDTPGIRWTDSDGLRRLRRLLEAIPAATVHLLMAASMRVRDQARYVEAFRSLGPQAVIFTKLDETHSYGCLLTTPLKAGVPVAYTCDGQRVPEDLHPADAASIVDCILAALDPASGGRLRAAGAERMEVHDPARSA